jgi:Fur family ferric uptake transcriptional regulator
MAAAEEQIFKQKNLRSTPVRKTLLSLFTESSYALSHADIDQMTDGVMDRVTIYRTLKTFVDNGIIHEVIDENEKKYNLCSDGCSQHEHYDDHVHFKCNNCMQTFCLEHNEVPAIELPKGFKISSAQYLVMGICNNCS